MKKPKLSEKEVWREIRNIAYHKGIPVRKLITEVFRKEIRRRNIIGWILGILGILFFLLIVSATI